MEKASITKRNFLSLPYTYDLKMELIYRARNGMTKQSHIKERRE